MDLLIMQLHFDLLAHAADGCDVVAFKRSQSPAQQLILIN